MTAPNPLPDALDCFWNAALRVAHDRQNDTVFGVVSAIVEGVQAVSNRLRELEEVPATNQAGEVERIACDILRALGRDREGAVTVTDVARVIPFLAAIATQPATSQEGKVRPKAIAPDEWAAAEQLAQNAIDGGWRRPSDIVQVIAAAFEMERARS